MTQQATKQMTEAQMVGLVRNALLVAGYEMGQTGDHWPVINDTIHSIARDWEESRSIKAADEEMKIHLYEKLESMERQLSECPSDTRAEIAAALRGLRDAYDAYFTPLDESAIEPVNDDELPTHIKRAEVILASLGGQS